ncbi:MAG: hypothetical protein RJB61_790, partial [Actinomycetota bacterium]
MTSSPSPDTGKRPTPLLGDPAVRQVVSASVTLGVAVGV